MSDAKGPGRERLGLMLKELWEAAGGPPAGSDRGALKIDRFVFQSWRSGAAAPSPDNTEIFWSVVRVLQKAAGGPVYSQAEWQGALRLAQNEARAGQRLASFQGDSSHVAFVRPHLPAIDAMVEGELRGREDDRAVMDALVGDRSEAASSYLCWYAEDPVGKTTLLADYIVPPPRRADILNFFVTADYGADTRAAFEKAMAAQIAEFLGEVPSAVPMGVRQWRNMFEKVARRSRENQHRLLLVVDGLDDDVAWSGPAEGAAERSGGGSIAALLPLAPAAGMRVIVSIRRGIRFPDDVPSRHPLRQLKYRRALTSVPGLSFLRGAAQPRVVLAEGRAARVVAELLATAGGGLRTTDLTDLMGEPVSHLMEGPQGRAFVIDDPVARTYALADPSRVQAIRENLGDEGAAQCARALLDWSQRWEAEGWPESTPPYPLTHQLRLLTDATERAAYALDFARLRRLAAVFGLEAALAQLDAFEAEIDVVGIAASDTDTASVVDSAALVAPVRIAAIRAMLRRQARKVPTGAPALLLRLGEPQRARRLARSALTPEARAVHLAHLAVETVREHQDGAQAIAEEAAGWLTRADRDSAGPYPDRAPETNAGLLDAARSLVEQNAQDAALPLLLSVASDWEAPAIDMLVEAVKLMGEPANDDITGALRERAFDLSLGDFRARTVAVELWGALARIRPSLSPAVGNCIANLCDDLDLSAGLGALDVIAVAASELFALPAPRSKQGGERFREVWVRIREVVADPEALSLEDRAHLGRELAGTLARIAHAAVGRKSVPKAGIDDFEELLDSLSQDLRVGVLGDDISDRARSIVADARKRVAEEDRRWKAKEAEKGKTRAESKVKDARDTGGSGGSKTRRLLVPQPQNHHQPSAGLPSLGDGPQLDLPKILLHEAERLFATGDILGSREQLAEALHSATPTLSESPTVGGWAFELSQALGEAGDVTAGECLARASVVPSDRARHLAALSLGCSLGGDGEAGTRCAHEAARLMPVNAEPSLANFVAQALAHAGDGPAALAIVAGRVSERRQAKTAIAAGLVGHSPEEAARIAESLTEELANRIDRGSPLSVLPELASLLLAYPDAHHPDPRLHEVLQLASERAAFSPQTWQDPSMALLSLLERLGYVPEEAVHVVAGFTGRWRHSLRPGQDPGTELAVLLAVDGDTVGLQQHAMALADPGARAKALWAGAAHLAGCNAVLAVSRERLANRTLQTCLAIARRPGDGSPPDEVTARYMVRSLLRAGAWTHTISLLPQLAPEALGHLSTIALVPGQLANQHPRLRG